jgi:hypothetical protein
MGMFRYTAASQAMSAFRHRFMTHDICVHDNADVKALERSAYFGGRTELFRAGKFQEKMHQLDVSSLFPSVMKHSHFPIRLNRFMRTSRWSSNLPELDWHNCVAHVWLDTKNPIYPVKTPNGIVYPIGQFETTLCGQELEYAFFSSDICSVQSWAEYETAPIFTEWVEYMWALRQKHESEGDAIYAKLVKLMLNGLYGKFAQRSAMWVNVSGDLAATPWSEWTEHNTLTGESKRYRSFGWQLQEFVGKGELSTTFIAISAFVSAAARMRMNSLREQAGKENVYYQGVDGLIVTEEGRRRLDAVGEIRDNALGKLRHQLTVDEGEILGYCDYKLGTKTVKSGLAGNAIVTPDFELMQQIQHVTASLFAGGLESGVRKIDTIWHRQEMAAKGVMDSTGVVWPFVFSGTQPV